MKKAIDWFALVIGLALALFGAKWMWTGWDIVQAERGWAALIAGSVMLSGGLVVAMLAWTTMRLAGAFASARVVQPVVSEPPAGAHAPSPPIPAPALAVGAGAVAAATAAGVAFAREETHEVETGRAADEEPRPEPVAEEPIGPPAAPPSVSELLRRSEDRPPRDPFDLDAHVEASAPPRPVAPPLPPIAPIAPPPPPPPALEAEPENAPSAEPDDEDDTPVSESPTVVAAPDLSEEPAAPEPPAEPAPAPEPELAKAEPEPLRLPDPVPPPPPVDEPVYDDWLERTAREFDRELGRDGLPKSEPPPVEAPPPPPPQPEPAIVGRYSSGDTNYLMFADGSIEAQTPEGVMRFASLTELKRFVEKRN